MIPECDHIIGGATCDDCVEEWCRQERRDCFNFRRIWAMPSSETFQIEPIRQFVEKYLRTSKRSIDPFARNCQMATVTNDMNPDTSAQYHLEAHEFLKTIEGPFDLAIYDPPYSPRQVKECYESIGLKMSYENTLHGKWRKLEKDLLAQLMPVGSVFLCFGWNTCGMGIERGFQIEEILLVAHGANHNDTICMAERRISKQDNLL